MTQLGETSRRFQNLPLGRSRDAWREPHARLLESMGFNGERLTLFKYVIKLHNGRYVSDLDFAKEWEVGSYTHERHWQPGIIGQIRGLYAAEFSYFIRHRIEQPLLLLEMIPQHLVETDGRVVVASAYKTLDVLDQGLTQSMRVAYESLYDKKRLGQALSWQEVMNILQIR